MCGPILPNMSHHEVLESGRPAERFFTTQDLKWICTTLVKSLLSQYRLYMYSNSKNTANSTNLANDSSANTA